MMSYSSHECNEKSKQIEEKTYRLEQEKSALEHQLQNQAEVLAAARQNIQTQQTKLSHVENSIIEQKRTTEKLLADLKAFEAFRTNGDIVSSQMEEIMNTLREHEKEMSSLHGEVARFGNYPLPRRKVRVTTVQSPTYLSLVNPSAGWTGMSTN